MKFYKYSGAKNLFLIGFSENLEALKPFKAQKLSQQFAVDGILLIKQESERSHFRWNFLNADGSDAEMCGNAARCVAHLLLEEGQIHTEAQLLTAAGAVGLVITEERKIEVQMPSPKILGMKTLHSRGKSYEGLWVNTGVPHFVITVSSQHEVKKSTCKELRHNHELGRQGANVTLVIRSSGSIIEAVTYERGVEDFTAACGTGAVAAALSLREEINGQTKDQIIEVRMPGGALSVDFRGEKVFLSGPTEQLTEVEIDLDQV